MNALVLGLALSLPGQPPLPYPPAPPVPIPVPVPLPPPGADVTRPVTLDEFVRCFRPVPGIHQVWFVHPRTSMPVFVSFTLPAGCGAPKVKHGRRYVKFDYPKTDVEIEFRSNGKVAVEY